MTNNGFEITWWLPRHYVKPKEKSEYDKNGNITYHGFTHSMLYQTREYKNRWVQMYWDGSKFIVRSGINEQKYDFQTEHKKLSDARKVFFQEEHLQ